MKILLILAIVTFLLSLFANILYGKYRYNQDTLSGEAALVLFAICILVIFGGTGFIYYKFYPDEKNYWFWSGLANTVAYALGFVFAG